MRKKKIDYERSSKKHSKFASKFEEIREILESFVHAHKRNVPITFNLGIAVILFFCYLSIAIVTIPTQPEILVLLIPTLYIIVRHIKLEREMNDRELR